MFWTHENTEGLAAEELRTINEVRATLLAANPRIDAHAIDETVLPETIEIWREIENIPGWREGEVATVGVTYPRPDGWVYALLGQHPVRGSCAGMLGHLP